VRHYERLLAWQECHRLVLEVYRVTQTFPRHELYGLTSQARRAAVSAAVNIVEGSAKKGPAEFRRFLDISLGSLSELAYLMQVPASSDFSLRPSGVN
jgi:four helix bundle protein